jgi:cytidylate kinase
LKDKGSDVSLAALSREIEERDRQDQTRPIAPLVPAADALVIDSTNLSIAQVVERVWQAGAAHGFWGA